MTFDSYYLSNKCSFHTSYQIYRYRVVHFIYLQFSFNIQGISTFNFFFFLERQTATCSASFGCAWNLGNLTFLLFSYKWTWRDCLESLPGKCRCSHTLTEENGPPVWRKVVLLGQALSFRRRSEGERGHLPSQQDQPSQHW